MSTLTAEVLDKILRDLTRMPPMPPPIRIQVIPDHHLPQEHYASRVHIHRWHPFAVWCFEVIGRPLYRALGLTKRAGAKPYDVLPGWALYRAKPVSYLLPNGVLVCSQRVADQIRREIPAAPPHLQGSFF